MALIPGEGSTIPNIGSGIGSGIDIVTTSGGVDLLSAFLVAGTNVTIVPSVSNKSITINAAPGGGGIISVDAAAGAGVTTTTTAAHVSITSAIVGGTGISVVQSPTTTTLTINNDQTITTANGCGISAVVAGDATALSANLVAGAGVSVTPSVLNTSQTIANTGVTSLAASGAGISVSSPTGDVSVSNTGVTSIVAGTGVAISGATGAVTISTTPVISPTIKLSRVGVVGTSSVAPVAAGTTGYQGITVLAGAFNNDIIAGTSPDPNGVWVVDFNPVGLLLTGSFNTGVVNIGLGNSTDAGIYYNTYPNISTFGSPPATVAPRSGSCAPLIVKVSDLIATCPTMASASTRIYFQNTSSDAMWIQTLPTAINCTYYPNGVQ
jgi:hypothetical protein